MRFIQYCLICTQHVIRYYILTFSRLVLHHVVFTYLTNPHPASAEGLQGLQQNSQESIVLSLHNNIPCKEENSSLMKKSDHGLTVFLPLRIRKTIFANPKVERPTQLLTMNGSAFQTFNVQILWMFFVYDEISYSELGKLLSGVPQIS